MMIINNISKPNNDRVNTSEQKKLVTKLMGQFYTPKNMGLKLISNILHVIKNKNIPIDHIIDPFCGDGRLIVWLLEEMAAVRDLTQNTLNIELWDCDESALKNAADKIFQIGLKLKLRLNIQSKIVDTFEYAPQHLGKFNIVVTNPPWEILKPDSREFQKLTKQEIQNYKNWLKAKDELLTKLYPLSQPKRKYSGWGTNLARCGTEVALRLTASQGICGLITPASLLADQMTEKLRSWLLREHVIHQLEYYPAEAKLFNNVDQSSITLVVTPERSEQFSPLLTVYDHKCEIKSRDYLSMDWDSMEANDFTLPVHFGGDQIRLFSQWATLQRFGDLEGNNNEQLWAGREIDETGHKTFLGEEGKYLFLKGRMIQRFTITTKPSQYLQHKTRKIPLSADHYRIAWRDVSRPSQKRRIHATLIPPGWVTGNSLHVAYFRNDDCQRLKALLGIMNSFVFEFQLRAYLATSHVSLSSVRKVRIPSLSDEQLVKKLAQLVDKCLGGCETSQIKLEIEVAQAYGLRQEDFKLLLSAFDKLTNTEINALLPKQVIIPNHYTPNLSDLDLQMVKAVPPGGNW